MKTSKRKKKALSKMTKKELVILQMNILRSTDWNIHNMDNPGFQKITKVFKNKKKYNRKRKHSNSDY